MMPLHLAMRKLVTRLLWSNCFTWCWNGVSRKSIPLLFFLCGASWSSQPYTHANLHTFLELKQSGGMICTAKISVPQTSHDLLKLCLYPEKTNCTHRASVATIQIGMTFPFVVTNEGEYAICYIITTERVDGAKSWVMTLLFFAAWEK